ncbi:hypothetical protein N7G274_010383 [Stereocaulon virgatum]|uniref:Methyltransferase n=1 Tax=Stereocaulon virgatum TaxID=373712 RepID=A0ABR3ZVU1_9LECA
MEPKHERRQFMYLQWEDKFRREKPYQIVSENIPELDGLARSNINMIEGPEELIENIRGRESTFTLDQNGFQILRHQFPPINYQSNDEVENVYKPEIERLLKEEVEGVDRVVFFNWRLRLNVARDSLANLNDPLVPLVPAHNVHLDQSPATAVQYVYEKMGEEAETYLQGRVRIFNIWRPYAHHVEDCPLALCDGSTIRGSDLVICDNIQKTRLGETLLPLYNPDTKWYYLNGQHNDEVTVIKIFDSDADVAASCCPHTAFYHRNIPPDVPPRQSIEVRALIFTKPD